MAFTDTGSNSGAVYDVDENARLKDLATKLENSMQESERTVKIKKDVVRYAIIGVSAILILFFLKKAIKNK